MARSKKRIRPRPPTFGRGVKPITIELNDGKHKVIVQAAEYPFFYSRRRKELARAVAAAICCVPDTDFGVENITVTGV